MSKFVKRVTVAALAAGLAGTLGATLVAAQAQNNPAKMSFFITSKGSGKGGDLGGLAGADAHCAALATAAGAPKGKVWRAYLSAPGTPAVNARDRIGAGPWFNAHGLQVAANVDDLHSANNKLGAEGSLTEAGMKVPGRGSTPNQHDILTGSDQNGRLAPVPPPAATATASPPSNMTCNGWTSSTTGQAMVGHHDKQGGGANPTSWNSAHASRSCSQQDLIATGGAGYFYCFAP